MSSQGRAFSPALGYLSEEQNTSTCLLGSASQCISVPPRKQTDGMWRSPGEKRGASGGPETHTHPLRRHALSTPSPIPPAVVEQVREELAGPDLLKRSTETLQQLIAQAKDLIRLRHPHRKGPHVSSKSCPLLCLH